MAEWRRTLKSWPKETLQTADPTRLPEWVRESAKERLAAAESPKRRNLKTALTLTSMAAFMVLFESLPENDPWKWALVALIVAAFPLLIVSIKRSRERKEARRRHRAIERLEAIGEATLGGDFVGVSYSGEHWSYPALGTRVDEGILLLELDRLTFAGGRTRFDLPAHAITGTHIRKAETGLGVGPRLYVDWACEGQAGTFAMELPYRASMRQRVTEGIDLQERIERWRRDPFPTRSISPLLPLRMEVTKKIEVEKGVGLLAHFLSGLVKLVSMIGIMVALETLLILSHHREWSERLGGVATATSFVWIGLWFSAAERIEARLPQRFRYQPKVSPGVREALRKVEASTIAEPAADARIKQ